MKDLDFDELDKAVNSLMSKTNTSASNQSVPISVTSSSPTPDSRPLIPPAPQPTASTPVSSTIAVTSFTPTPKPSVDMTSSSRTIVKPPVKSFSPSEARPISRPTVPAKRSGRFMDLVPSSSELQSPMKSPSPRQGTTLTPLNDNITADAPTPASPESIPPEATQVSAPTLKQDFSRSVPPSVSPLAASMSMSARTKHDDMPDPLDVHEQIKESSQEGSSSINATPQALDTPSNEPNTDLESPAQPAINEPAVSPFLTDAKVDKRPLGSASAASATPSLSQTSPLQSQLSVLPAELNTALLAVESDLPSDTQVKSPTPQRAQSNEELTLPVSITQQYRQQPRSGDQSHAAVYDTAAHPVSHPQKKKSNVLLIIVIATIIIIAGGGVAALFALGYI